MFKHNHPPRSSSGQAGQNLVEYGIIILLVGIAVVLALTALRPAIENAFARFIANAPVAPPSIGPIGGQFTPRPAPNVAFSAQAYQASEASGSVSIQVILSYPFSQPITVDVVTVAGSATSPDDFTSATFPLTFAANETAKTVTITLINDTTVEDEEDFEVQLANASLPSSNVGGPATITIVDDDTPPVFTFAQTAYNVLESVSLVKVVVTMDRVYAGSASINYATVQNGTATGGGVDYQNNSNVLNFPTGTISQTINIVIVNDGNAEPNETFGVQLSNAVAGGNPATISGVNPVTITITDDETPPTVSLQSATLTVSETGPNALLNVILSRSFDVDVFVEYQTFSGTGANGAQAGSDFTGTSSPVALTFSPGQTSKVITVPILDDSIAENSETFTIQLVDVNPTSITIQSPSIATVTITDNDCAYGPFAVPSRVEAEKFRCHTVANPTYADSDSTNTASPASQFRQVDAPGADLRVNNQASGAIDLAQTVAGEWLDYAITVAQAGPYDFVIRAAAPSAGASIRLRLDGVVMGSVITIPSTGNSYTYQDVSLPAQVLSAGSHILRLEIVTGGAFFDYINVQTAVGPSIQFSAASYNVTENGVNATITVNLSFASAQEVRVSYATSNGTATAGSDYTATSGQLIIPALSNSGTFNVPITNDAIVDLPAETVNLALSSPINGSLGPQSTAILYIIDDECAFSVYTVPGRVEAENFICGGQGTAYNDTTTGNAGTSTYRFWESADISSGGTSNGNHISNTRNGEWLKYNINLGTAGLYNGTVRVAANNSTTQFSLQIDGTMLYGPYTVPNTGDLNTFTTVTIPGIYFVTSGQHTVQLNIINSGSNDANFDYLEFSTMSNVILLSLGDDDNNITGLPNGAADDEDILIYSGGIYSMLFDGEDVGAGVKVQDFQLMPDGTILMTFGNLINLGGTTYNIEDIARFTPTGLGLTTSGSFSMFLDGSTYGLSSASGDIDGFFVDTNGTILLSTVTDPGLTISGTTVRDEDIIRLNTSTSQWTWFVDGSDIGLADAGGEDIDAFWLASNGSSLYFSTLGNFTVTGLTGRGNDVAIFTATAFGATTTGTFTNPVYFNGNNNGLSGELIDGLYLVP